MKRPLRIAACALLLLTAAASRADEFTQRAIKVFKAADPTLQITSKDDDELLVKFASVETLTTYLDNPRKVCALHPDECNDALDHFAKTITADLSPDKHARTFAADKLYPVLRSTSYAIRFGQLSKGPAKGLAVRPFAPGVDQLFIIDGETSIQFVTLDEQAKSGMTVDAMLATALANAAHLQAIQPVALPERAGLFALMYGDTLGSARMFDAAMWDRIEKDAGGPVAVAVPTRDWILYTRLDDDARVADLRTLARKVAAREAYGVAGAVLRRDGKGWAAVPEH